MKEAEDDTTSPDASNGGKPMRFVVATVAALAGLLGAAGSAQAQGFAPRCPQACGCGNWGKYSGNCVYPEQRAIPPDPWANRCGGGRGGCGTGVGNRDMMWSRYLRSPRDFWMVGGCYPSCR
jgi:hypothetical protein